MFSIRILHIALELWGSVFCLITALCIFISRSVEEDQRRIVTWMQLNTAILLFTDAMSWLYRGYPGVVGYYAVRIFNFAVFLSSNVITLLYHRYVCSFLYKKQDRRGFERYAKRVYAGYLIGLASVVLVIISQFIHLYYYFDHGNFYHRKVWYPVSLVLPFTVGLLDFTLLIQHRKKLKTIVFVSLISYVILPMVAAVIIVKFYGFSLINIAITISMIMMVFSAVIEHKNVLEQKEKEMSELRIEVMLSQISPHFIYNTLTAIQYLCTKNPEMAEETVGEFAAYLRGTIDSLTAKKCIPFDKELSHVKNYLAIEKKRFGERVKVEYDIETKNFCIPTLTLQPMVENAVKYGISKKEQGGTIVIHTEKKGSEYLIVIKDDGVGFDRNSEMEDGRAHVGINNVCNRLESMCNGKMDIKSTVGEGTEVTIHIPELVEKGSERTECKTKKVR